MRRIASTVVLALWGCGGQTEPGPGSSGTDAGTGRDGSGSRPRDKLPECRKGFLPADQPDQACPWIAEGRCYDEKLAACACVCSAATSYCISGLPRGDMARVEVDCI